MARALLVPIVALAFGCATQSGGKRSNARVAEKLALAARTYDAADPAIAAALESPRPALRIAALVALARIEDPRTLRQLAPALVDPDPAVAAAAAFAVGQLGDREAEAALLAALATSPATAAVLDGLARAGTAAAIPKVAAHLGDARPEVRASAAYALGVIAKRLGADTKVGEETAEALTKLLASTELGDRQAASYALLRLPSPDLHLPLVAALADPDPDVRLHAVRGLADPGRAASVFDPVLADPDWRVRYEVAKALAKLSDKDGAEKRLAAMRAREIERFVAAGRLAAGPSAHVLGAIVDGAVALSAPGILDGLVEVIGDRGRFAETALFDRARLDCQLAFAFDAFERTERRVRTCGDAALLAWRRVALELELLARRGAEAEPELAGFLAHEDSRIRVLAVEKLGELRQSTADARLRALLDDPDLAVAAAAAAVLAERTEPLGVEDQDRAIRGLVRAAAHDDRGFAIAFLDLAKKGPLPTLRPILDRLLGDPHPAIRRRAAAALGALTGVPVFAPPAAPRPAPPPAPGRTRIAVETARGTFAIELDGDRAPATVGWVRAWIEAGFYSGRRFHRVVPNFVVQGGCDRGDGYGGAGAMIEDEASPTPFLRGAVGVATQGRDTAGSQLFVLHSPAPHLRGGYTWIGQVVDGMDVVDALGPDDEILRVSVAPAE